MRKLPGLLLGLAAALALVAVVRPAFAAPAAQQSVALMAELRGGPEEVPNPGDPDGTGSATVTLDMAGGQITFSINTANLTLPASAAHIHEGERGVAGPVVVPLTAPGADGTATGSVAADAALMQRIQQNPAGFYVNVHTSDYPSGAVRGQLMLPAAQTTPAPTGQATAAPTMMPTMMPTGEATAVPTGQPTSAPTGQPTSQATAAPTGQPTSQATAAPTGQPTSPAPATLPNTGASDGTAPLLAGLALLTLLLGLGLRLNTRRRDG